MKYLVNFVIGLLWVGFAIAQETAQIQPQVSVQAGLGYNSNPYSLTQTQIAGKSPGDMQLRLSPVFALANQGKKLSLSAGGSGNLSWMVGLNDNPMKLLFNGNANGATTYNPGGKVSLFTRGSLNASRSLGELFVGDMTNLTGNASLGGTWRPGGGKIGWTVQGEYQVQGYPGVTYNSQTTVPKSLNNQGYYLASRLSWQFLPKTALFTEGRYGFYETIDSNQVHVTTNPLSAGAGLTGRITDKLTATLSGHFSKILLKTSSQSLASTSFPFAANAILNWTLNPRISLAMNLSRGLNPTPIYLDSASNNISINYNQKLGQKFNLTLMPSFGLLQYGKPTTNLSTINYRTDSSYLNRNDFFTEIQINLLYAMNEWCSLGVSGDGFWRWTNSNPDGNQILGPSGWVAQGDGSNFQSLYNRYQANVFVRLSY